MKIKLFFLSALLCAAVSGFAQTPPPDGLVSPEVHSDGKVTFRIRAPKAAEVTLFGDWMSPGSTQPMTKNAEGIWSATLSGIEPTIHLYSFTVDGVTMADPVNPRVKLRQRTSASLVEIPSKGAPWEVRDVPHGSVEANWLRTPVINGETRQVFVYTPPGYEKNPQRRYPVLYLLHGSGDTVESWTQVGATNLILDNLIAEKKAVPMIVVMPLGHAVPFGSPREIQAKNVPLMEEFMLKDLMPWAESKYRIAPGRHNRALAGLSMGGGQTFAIGFGHLDLFSALGVFSSAPGQDFAEKFKTVLTDAKGTNAKLNVFWYGAGDKDPVFPRAKDATEMFNKHQIKHTFRVYEGGLHTWPIWRRCLSEFAPLLFHQR
ncbi:MAG TPA: alpha/beta hydrolase-fold protein [Blastocatellia bacterium]|nr:alpha/beta hydrolase-fold protein [Blastocatellia bacterium]HMZ23228.1 alpha/beta hydrolase-fold protein [Blastocatellia bacterium]HNG28960.1 alpha/beta hydrolase-fold protein [Blastocatellia bacterium]